MKNKKGFTLTEIIVVILLISIFFMIAVPSVMKVRSSIKTRELEAKREMLLTVAELYAKNNTSLFGDSTYIQIPIRTLVYYGYFSKDVNSNSEICEEPIGCVINPVDDTSMNDELITIKRIKVVEATFDPPPATVVMVRFYGNGATLSKGGTDSDSFANSCEVPCKIEVPTIKRSNFSLDGWSGNENTMPTDAENLGSYLEVTGESDKDYYAITHRDITVKFYPNIESTDKAETRNCTIHNQAKNCKITNTPTFTRNGYSFTAWYNASSGGSEIQSGSFNKLTKNISAYAQWNPNTYSITLNPNGGSYTSTPSGYTKSGNNYTRNYTVETATFTLPNPGKANNIFAGWTGSNGTTAQTSVSVTQGSTGDKSYTANWTACPASHPYSVAGATGIKSCYRYNTTASSTYSYTSCIYNTAEAALAACGSGKTSCSAVPCGTFYYILNYSYEGYTAKGTREYFTDCTTITRKTTDIDLVSTSGDESCNYYTDISSTGITNPSSYCKDGNNTKVLTAGCSISSTDSCNQLIVDIMLGTGAQNEGDCSSWCTGESYTGNSYYSSYTIPNVRTATNAASGRSLWFHQSNPSEGFIYKGSNIKCRNSNTYETCADYLKSHGSEGSFYSNVKAYNCKMTKAVYDITSYRLKYKTVTTGTEKIYYPN